MKFILIAFVVLMSGFAILGKTAFPGIDEGSWLRQGAFGFWTLLMPVAIAAYILWRILKR